VTLASAAASGEQGNGPSSGPTLSADGTKVTFTSNATNLVPGDTTGGFPDVFVRDLGGREAVYALGPGGSLTLLGGADAVWG
jgi:Tol biopolymer transport system component